MCHCHICQLNLLHEETMLCQWQILSLINVPCNLVLNYACQIRYSFPIFWLISLFHIFCLFSNSFIHNSDPIPHYRLRFLFMIFSATMINNIMYNARWMDCLCLISSTSSHINCCWSWIVIRKQCSDRVATAR